MKSLWALANVAGRATRAVDAFGSVLTGKVVTCLGSHLAVRTVEADGADASVVAYTGSLERK